MIKVCIFNKSNDVSRFDIFKKFFERVNSKISLTCCTENSPTNTKSKAKLGYIIVRSKARARIPSALTTRPLSHTYYYYMCYNES